jgi:hypothetical protein
MPEMKMQFSGIDIHRPKLQAVVQDIETHYNSAVLSKGHSHIFRYFFFTLTVLYNSISNGHTEYGFQIWTYTQYIALRKL